MVTAYPYNVSFNFFYARNLNNVPKRMMLSMIYLLANELLGYYMAALCYNVWIFLLHDTHYHWMGEKESFFMFQIWFSPLYMVPCFFSCGVRLFHYVPLRWDINDRGCVIGIWPRSYEIFCWGWLMDDQIWVMLWQPNLSERVLKSILRRRQKNKIMDWMVLNTE